MVVHTQTSLIGELQANDSRSYLKKKKRGSVPEDDTAGCPLDST